MKYEAGITEIVYPFEPRWTGIITEADSEKEAEEFFERVGFYRNLVIREREG